MKWLISSFAGGGAIRFVPPKNNIGKMSSAYKLGGGFQAFPTALGIISSSDKISEIVSRSPSATTLYPQPDERFFGVRIISVRYPLLLRMVLAFIAIVTEGKAKIYFSIKFILSYFCDMPSANRRRSFYSPLELLYAA